MAILGKWEEKSPQSCQFCIISVEKLHKNIILTTLWFLDRYNFLNNDRYSF